MRGRCLTLLLAFVAWFMVPAAPRVATAPAGPAIHHVATPGSPATVERASDRSDRRVRPEFGGDVLPGSQFALPILAAAPAASSSPALDTPFVPRTRSSAQPRGPPVA
jgi:hypothetical protein